MVETRPVFVIRPAVAADREAVVALVQARARWMRARGHQGWPSWMLVAESLGDQAAAPGRPVWVLATPDGTLAGVTTAEAVTPPLAWSADERAESALILHSTVTHPDRAGQGTGTLVAFWALDHAFRHGRVWVRRNVLTSGATDRGLLRYYRSQGWRVVRAVPHPHRPDALVWSLQRPAQPQPDLASVVVEGRSASHRRTGPVTGAAWLRHGPRNQVQARIRIPTQRNQ